MNLDKVFIYWSFIKKNFNKYLWWILLIIDLVFYVISGDNSYLVGAGVILFFIILGKIMFRKEDSE